MRIDRFGGDREQTNKQADKLTDIPLLYFKVAITVKKRGLVA